MIFTCIVNDVITQPTIPFQAIQGAPGLVAQDFDASLKLQIAFMVDWMWCELN